MTAQGATSTSSASLAPPATNAPAEISVGTHTAPLDRCVERLLEALEHTHHSQPALAVRARAPPLDDAVDEMLALDPERLDVQDRGRDDPPAAGDVLAVAAGVLIEALVVD